MKLYTAMSMNGMIAGPNDEMTWLDNIPNPENTDYGYAEFYAGITTTFMGNSTYRWMLEQGFPFPYTQTKNYVFTRNRDCQSNNHVEYINHNVLGRVREIRKRSEGDVWLIGGGELNKLFLENGLVDEIWVFVMPYILGAGKPIFKASMPSVSMTLFHSRIYKSGVCELRYRVST